MPCCRESGFWSFHFPMQWGLGASALPSAIEWTCISLHWDINNMGLSFVLVRLRCSSHCLDIPQCPFRGVAAIEWDGTSGAMPGSYWQSGSDMDKVGEVYSTLMLKWGESLIDWWSLSDLDGTFYMDKTKYIYSSNIVFK